VKGLIHVDERLKWYLAVDNCLIQSFRYLMF